MNDEDQHNQDAHYDIANIIEMMSLGHTQENVAANLGISRRTLRRILSGSGVDWVRQNFISDNLLDLIIAIERGKEPALGITLMRGLLRSMGVEVSLRRVRKSFHRLASSGMPVGGNRIRRRQYSVKAPLSLWHIDGNHKLVKWGFYIHGGVDGYSRLIVFLNLSWNNRSNTVLSCFQQAISRYGLPARVRADNGGENVGVGHVIRRLRQTENSFITGRSVHNIRVERMWRDMRQSCIGKFKNLFEAVEEQGSLSSDSIIDCIALHYCFRHVIAACLAEFQEMWNHHEIRTECSSPLVLFNSGLAELLHESGGDVNRFPELVQSRSRRYQRKKQNRMSWIFLELANYSSDFHRIVSTFTMQCHRTTQCVTICTLLICFQELQIRTDTSWSKIIRLTRLLVEIYPASLNLQLWSFSLSITCLQ